MTRKFTLLAFCALLVVAGCGGEKDSGTADKAMAATGGFGIGKLAPDFTLKDVAGKAVSLSDYRGKAVIVDFWATWCPPCRASMPHLQDLSEEYADKLVVLAVSLDQNPAAVVPAFVDKMGLTFTVLADPRGPEVAAAYGNVQSIPTTYLIDPQGTVVKAWVGLNAKETYEKEVKQVLAI